VTGDEATGDEATGDGFDPLDTDPDEFPPPGDDGPDQPIVEAALAWEAAHARAGWDQMPQLLWVRHPPGGPPRLTAIPVPEQLLRAARPYDAASYVAHVLTRLGPAAAMIIPADLAGVAMAQEAWAVPRPDDRELGHLKKLRAQRKLWTRPEWVEMRYVHIVDLAGNEADVIRERGIRGTPDHVETQQWGAARMARFYRGDALVALRELVAVLRQHTGTPGPPPDYRTVFGLN